MLYTEVGDNDMVGGRQETDGKVGILNQLFQRSGIFHQPGCGGTIGMTFDKFIRFTFGSAGDSYMEIVVKQITDQRSGNQTRT
jgi:hypothetical protein